MGRRGWWLWLCVVGLVWLVPGGVATAQEPNRAGLVVQYGDGRTEQLCVPFQEPMIRGIDLLARSGLSLTVDAQAGTIVCSIGSEGCSFPAENCFCQCQGLGTCLYWSYHTLDPVAGWQYSQIGAAQQMVLPGSVQGWTWGIGGSGSAAPPPLVTFDQICALQPTPPAAPAPLPTHTVTAPPTPVPTPPPATARTEIPSPTATPPGAAAAAAGPTAVVTERPASTSTATRGPGPTPPPAPTLTAAATSTVQQESTPPESGGRRWLLPLLAAVGLAAILWARRGG